MKPTRAQICAYFRMGLVTGLVAPSELISWADRQILEGAQAAPFDLIELSLAGSQTLSQVAGLLNHLQSPPGDEVPYRLLFARASLLLEADPSRSTAILQELRLLLAEEYLPRELRATLKELLAGQADDLQRLKVFLAPYQDTRQFLP